MQDQAKIHLTRMPHKKYEQAVFAIYLNDDMVGSLRPSESLTVETIPGLVKLKAVISEKPYIKLFMIKQPGTYYYNLEIREPKWYLGFKFFAAGFGLILFISALLSDPVDFKSLGIGAFCFLFFLDKREKPEWVEVRVE
jgi:hypothetical protein